MTNACTCGFVNGVHQQWCPINGTLWQNAQIPNYIPYQSPVQPFVAQGWQCPVCKSVMAPMIQSCVKCPVLSHIVTTTNAG